MDTPTRKRLLRHVATIRSRLPKTEIEWLIFLDNRALIPWQEATEVLVDNVDRVVRNAADCVHRREGVMRRVFSFDRNDPNRLKSILSIREGIERLFEEARQGKINAADHLRLRPLARKRGADFATGLLLQLHDIGRCRVLCCYPSDIDNIKDRLVEHFNVRNAKDSKGCDFHILKSEIKDHRVETGPPFRSAGHRAVHLPVKVLSRGLCMVLEIQLMTMLQAAWDAKEHPIYEMRRKKGVPAEAAGDRMHSLSGLLMIADEYSQEVWRKMRP